MVREGNYVLGLTDCNRPKEYNSFRPLMFEQIISNDSNTEPPKGAGIYRDVNGENFAVSIYLRFFLTYTWTLESL